MSRYVDIEPWIQRAREKLCHLLEEDTDPAEINDHVGRIFSAKNDVQLLESLPEVNMQNATWHLAAELPPLHEHRIPDADRPGGEYVCQVSGKLLILTCECEVTLGEYVREPMAEGWLDWFDGMHTEVTHWMPLPALPDTIRITDARRLPIKKEREGKPWR